MRPIDRVFVVAALLLIAHAAGAAEQLKPEVLATDSQRQTAGGTTFTAPGGWTLSGDGGRIPVRRYSKRRAPLHRRSER
jgi:hypothetical protein